MTKVIYNFHFEIISYSQNYSANFGVIKVVANVRGLAYNSVEVCWSAIAYDRYFYGGKWATFVSKIVDLLSQYVVVTCHNANLAKSK